MKNKQNLFRRLLAVMMLVLVMAFSTQTTAKAGFGDFNDYDSSDSWDSGWDSDYDSYDYDYDDDGGSGEFSPIAIVIVLIIVVYSIIESTRKKNKKTSGTATQRAPQHRAQAPAPADQTEAISQQIKAKDPLFTAQDFLAFAGDVYMDIQSAWEKRDLTPVRAVLHQNLYQQTEKQIQKKIQDGVVNHLERISVNKSYLMSYHTDEKYEYLDVYLAASMIDYQVKEATGEILNRHEGTARPVQPAPERAKRGTSRMATRASPAEAVKQKA